MLDVLTLEDRGRYRRDEYLRQAAHERLLRQLHPEVVHPSTGRPRRTMAGLGLALAGLAAVVSIVWPLQGL